MKRPHMGADGMYLIAGKKYEMVRGSRAQVWHGTAYKTSGGLTKDKLLMNKHGNEIQPHMVLKSFHSLTPELQMFTLELAIHNLLSSSLKQTNLV